MESDRDAKSRKTHCSAIVCHGKVVRWPGEELMSCFSRLVLQVVLLSFEHLAQKQ